jgi:acyl-CoA thioesterase I
MFLAFIQSVAALYHRRDQARTGHVGLFVPVRLLAVVLALSLPVCGFSAVTTDAAASPATYLSSVTAQLSLDWPKNRTVNIVCHGHSVPAGYFRTPEVRPLDSYPHLLRVGLAERFPHSVFNVIVTAIGGENSEQGAARFERDVLSLRPDVVTIDYGLNDRKLGLARAEAAWRSMIATCQAKGIPVILLTPTVDLKAKLANADDPLIQHAAQIRRLAAEHQVGLVDSLARFQAHASDAAQMAELMAQHNHPNRRGHELVAAGLLDFFPVPVRSVQ